jgi:hypothetical protein
MREDDRLGPRHHRFLFEGGAFFVSRLRHARSTRGTRVMRMSDDQIQGIETMVRELIKTHLSKKHRQAALAWLEERVAAHQAMIELKRLDKDENG